MKSSICLLFLLITVGCNNDNSTNSNQSKVESTAKSGTWRITYYNDSGKEETANYAGYNFTFGSSLTATNGTNTYNGTWSISDSNSNDDTMDDLHYNISFSTPAAFAKLSNDWTILETTDVKIKLTDVSGGGGGTDFLTFEKN